MIWYSGKRVVTLFPARLPIVSCKNCCGAMRSYTPSLLGLSRCFPPLEEKKRNVLLHRVPDHLRSDIAYVTHCQRRSASIIRVYVVQRINSSCCCCLGLVAEPLIESRSIGDFSRATLCCATPPCEDTTQPQCSFLPASDAPRSGSS